MPIKLADYTIFFDDERYPVDCTDLIVRSVDDAMWLIRNRGIPKFISFDHDMGYNRQTGADLANEIVNYVLDAIESGEFKGKHFVDHFDFAIHSQNPVGRENIAAKMYGLMQHVRTWHM